MRCTNGGDRGGIPVRSVTSIPRMLLIILSTVVSVRVWLHCGGVHSYVLVSSTLFPLSDFAEMSETMSEHSTSPAAMR